MPVTSKCGLLELACSMALYVLQVLGCFVLSHANQEGNEIYLSNFTATLQMSLVCNWIGHKGHSCREGNVGASASGLHMLCREVPIHDEGAYEFISTAQLTATQWMNQGGTHSLLQYLACQSCGRLIPGCGHAGQKTAIAPSCGASASERRPTPLSILFIKSLH